VLPCCRTRAHKACVAQYILAKAADAQLPVLCPRPDCRTRLPSAYIAASLSDAERERYNAAARFMKAKPEASADDAAEVDGLGLTRCPSCAHFVEKAEGCDTIACRCGCSFCYRCGAMVRSTRGGAWTPENCRCDSETKNCHQWHADAEAYENRHHLDEEQFARLRQRMLRGVALRRQVAAARDPRERARLERELEEHAFGEQAFDEVRRNRLLGPALREHALFGDPNDVFGGPPMFRRARAAEEGEEHRVPRRVGVLERFRNITRRRR